MKAESLSKSVRFALLAGSTLIFAGFGLLLRLDSLEERPMHADEATGARILADRLESDAYRFDPAHFHGPLLTALAEPVAAMRGEEGWESLTVRTLRLGPALFGGLTVLLALGFVRWTGAGAWPAAAFIATSPFLVYYSRMFIHETLFGFLAIGTVLALFHYAEKPGMKQAALAGLAAGLLMATRETFVICFFAWTIAGLAIWIERNGWSAPRVDWQSLRRPAGEIVLGGGVAAFIVAAFYTDFASRPAGFFDFFRTFFVYETGEGHDKPFGYYTWFLLWPKFQGGVWWTEAAVAAAALAGFVMSFGRERGHWVRFLAYSGVVQWLVYSFIAYKTPWLILVPWLHICLVAGAGAGYCLRGGGMPRKAIAAVLLLGILWWQMEQTGRATDRYASDARNPYAYVPTSPDVDRLEAWLVELSERFPEIRSGPVAVIGSRYWPLPWYLRELPATGYWNELPAEAEAFPVLLVLPQQYAAANERLEPTHTTLPRGLRAEVPLFLFLRNDLWHAYLENDEENP